MDFTEDVTLTLPDIRTKLADFSEGQFKNDHGLIVEIAAIHEGLSQNYNFYTEKELEKSLNEWLEPYGKPVLLNHDPLADPLGRVIGATMATEDDGTPFVRLQVAIADPAAIQKISDKRYLTGSVGGQAKESICSICSVDWGLPTEGRGLPCRHKRGRPYNGKLAYLEHKNIKWKEYSFVNMPGDGKSGVRSMSVGESDEWVKPARFFVLDMLQENITEYTETEDKDVLADLRKKDASPLYMGLKGAFLSAIAENNSKEGVNTYIDNTNENKEDHTEEKEMSQDAPVVEKDSEEQEDILAVTEELSDDLSAIKPQEEEVSEEDTNEEDKVEKPEVEEGERPQGQEKPKEADVDPKTSEGAPVSRESEEDKDDAVEEETKTDEQAEETELNEDTEDETVEPLVEQLKSEVEALKQENAKLKKALHRTLAERVVDSKIAFGLVEVSERTDAIEDHSSRTASSLADSLRDLAAMPTQKKTLPDLSKLQVDEKTEVVGEEDRVVTIGEEDEDSDVKVPKDPYKVAEDILVDTLMSRRRL